MSKLLLIEDDLPTRRQTAQVLRYEGFEVLEAENGAVGVNLAQESIPDLIICDIMMPELDGFGVLQALHDKVGTALIPFIFVTAKSAPSDRRQGMSDGADDYITKPYNPDDLIRSIRRRLEKRDSHRREKLQHAEDLSLAIANSLPQEMLESLKHITTTTHLLALKYEGLDPQVAEMHTAVTEEAQRLQNLMSRLQLYAKLPRLYARRFELINQETTSRPDLIVPNSCRQTCGHWGREEDLSVHIERATVGMSTEFLDRILEELVENACKFSEADSPIVITGVAQKGFWTLSVCNRGPELSTAQLNQIAAFKQFWTGNAKPRGIGIGLALTQGIARLHGCEFSIQSTGGSTCVSVLFPYET